MKEIHNSNDNQGCVEKLSLEDEVNKLRKQVAEMQSLHRKDTDWLKAELNKIQNKFDTVYKELTTSSSTTNSKANIGSEVELLDLTEMSSEEETRKLQERVTVDEMSPSRISGSEDDSGTESLKGLDEDVENLSRDHRIASSLGKIPSHSALQRQSVSFAASESNHSLDITHITSRKDSNKHESELVSSRRDSLNNSMFSIVGDCGEEEDLETDIYSLLMISSATTLPFFYAIIVAIWQFFITTLILIDLLVDERVVGAIDNNPLNVPSKVEWTVVCAQFLSLVIAFVTVDDIITSLKMFLIGYDPNIKKQYPGATYWKYIFSNSIRFVEGMGTTFVSVVIIVISKSVMDIFMNFVAVAFVSKLDNIAFQLAQDGLFGEKLSLDCKRVVETKVKVQRVRVGWAVNLLFVAFFLPFLFVLTLVTIWQNNGYLLAHTSCKNLEVHFGDEMLTFSSDVTFGFEGTGNNKTFPNSERAVPFLPEKPNPLLYQYFSGTYVVETVGESNRLEEFNSRPIYWERGVKDPISGKFYFCEKTKSWVFTIEALYNTTGAIPEESREDCEWGWLMQSPMTTALTLDEAPMTGWNIWTGDVEEAQAFSISCIDCSRNSDCGLTHGYCDLESSTCVCNENWQGRRCTQEKPHCPGIIWLDYGEDPTEYYEITPYGLTTNYDNTTFMIYDRPTYVTPAYVDVDNFTNFVIEMIMFTGRRWFDTYWTLEDIIISEDIDFHAYWDDIFERNTVYYSDPTESYLPTGFTWHQIRDSMSQGNFAPFGASFKTNAIYECLDVDCMDDPSICGFNGNCVEGVQDSDVVAGITFTHSFSRSYCNCSDNYGGFYCEYAPDGPYSMEVNSEFIADPASYSKLNSDLEYLKYWVDPASFSGNRSMRAGDL